MNKLRRTILAGAMAMAMTCGVSPSHAARVPAPAVTAVPGKPSLLIGSFDLAPLGYRADEFFLTGTATSYRLAGQPSSDGRWTAVRAAPAPYATRAVVIRPADGRPFNGTVIVEWLNVTAGRDAPADWMVAHRELIRKGYAWMGVSAQKVAVDGGISTMGFPAAPLTKENPTRYGTLHHPGDAFAFDIFSQAGAALRQPRSAGLLGPLRPRHLIAAGESQSAGFLTTYIDAIDPLARIYDGFLVHSRFGRGALLDGTPSSLAKEGPVDLRFRSDLRVPVLAVITETDLLGGRQPGYLPARQPDGPRLRVWEIAGTSHADNYLFVAGMGDSGTQDPAVLARGFMPLRDVPGGKLAEPMNPGLSHHYVVQAALAALDRWVTAGTAPASAPRLTVAPEGGAPALAKDANGIALGGIRTPWVDVPTARLAGVGNSGSPLAQLVGVGAPFDGATLARLYPGGRADYLRRFDVALSRAIDAGHLLAEDRQELLTIAATRWDMLR